MRIEIYRLYREGKIEMNGGGIAIYVQENMKLKKMSIDGVEMITVYIENLTY